jgi:hypothetical protein
MSVDNIEDEIPSRIASTPINVVYSDARCGCPVSNCEFKYWTKGNRPGERTPTIEDTFSARDEPCQHYHTKWNPTDEESLEAVLEATAETASKIFCVIDKQVPLNESVQFVIIYIEKQTALGEF